MFSVCFCEDIQQYLKMSVPGSEDEIPFTEAQAVAESMSAKDYFLAQQQKLVNDWADKSVRLFNFTGDVLKSQYEFTSSDLIERATEDYEGLYNQSRKQFEAYCILNRKVQKKGDEIENFATFFNSKNHKRTFFSAWKQHTIQNKHLRKMEERSEKYHHTRTMKTCLKEWLEITMRSNRNKIKNDVLQRTEIQISKIQEDYEKLIKNLEDVLEKKLIELKKEEEEHKLLHDKYEAMYSRAKIENI